MEEGSAGHFLSWRLCTAGAVATETGEEEVVNLQESAGHQTQALCKGSKGLNCLTNSLVSACRFSCLVVNNSGLSGGNRIEGQPLDF